MNTPILIELHKTVKGSQDPRKQSKATDEVVATVRMNVTDMSAATSYRDYGQTAYKMKILRSVYPVKQFDYCVINGVKYTPVEWLKSGLRTSIHVKEC